MIRTEHRGLRQISLHFCHSPRAPQLGQYAVTSGSPPTGWAPREIRTAIAASSRLPLGAKPPARQATGGGGEAQPPYWARVDQLALMYCAVRSASDAVEICGGAPREDGKTLISHTKRLGRSCDWP